MSKKIQMSPLAYLIFKQIEGYSNADADYYLTDKGTCELSLKSSTKTKCSDAQIKAMNAAIANNPKLAEVDQNISNEYQMYVAKGGSKDWKKWLDEDYYKTEEGKNILEGLGKIGGYLGGLFGEQATPDLPSTTGEKKTSLAGISPIWFIFIILLIVGSLVALFMVAGTTKKPKDASAPAPAPVPVPAPAPAPAADGGLVEDGAVIG